MLTLRGLLAGGSSLTLPCDYSLAPPADDVQISLAKSVVQPGMPVSSQHRPVPCGSTSLDFDAKLRGRLELRVKVL